MEFAIRPICLKDAPDINEIRRMSGVMENILGIPSETVSNNERFISNMDGNAHEFVAVIADESGKEKVIGCAGLNVYASPRMRHSAGIGIMVHKAYQGMGVGQKLMEGVLDLADNWLMLVRVELTVYTDNEKAIRLYEKMGFVREGVKRKAAIRRGQYADEYIMARIRND
ncbi:GNAT family N-acetyltransferase [Caproiciproducens sp. R2]|uniref:GNAT family N-acetyltransferase n=1 Tax=Caproiciproducens sp. R2 TaxID=3435187 RepID=UPI004034CFC4